MPIARHLLAGFAVIAVASAAQAQTDPKAVFEPRYAELRAALETKDPAAVGKVVTPDYAMTDIRGDSHDVPGLIAMSDRMQGKNGTRKSELLSAAITGETAKVELKVDSTSTRQGMDGQVHQMELIAISDDSWVLIDGIWRLKSSVQKDLTVMMDGEERFHQAN